MLIVLVNYLLLFISRLFFHVRTNPSICIKDFIPVKAALEGEWSRWMRFWLNILLPFISASPPFQGLINADFEEATGVKGNWQNLFPLTLFSSRSNLKGKFCS